jgi:hypothetical protein
MKLSSGIRLLILGGLLFLFPILAVAAETGPATVKLDSLADLYRPVEFNHAMHVDLVDGKCATCHHHTTGAAPLEPRCQECHRAGEPAKVVACRDCHTVLRFSAEYLAELAANPQLYHNDKPGLKGAYHRKCLGCHQENGGPTGCQDCHERTKAGDAIFRTDVTPAPKTE